MKWLRCIFGALLAVAFHAPLSAQARNGTIRGVVTDAQSKQGLQGVLIDFGGRRTLTLTDGRFTLTAPAGTDTLKASTLARSAAGCTFPRPRPWTFHKPSDLPVCPGSWRA